MDVNHFNSYKAEDFLTDETFCEIVRKGNHSIQSLKERFPFRKLEIDIAVEMLHQLKKMDFQQSPEKKLEHWDAVWRKHKRSIRLKILRYAASILVFAGIGSVTIYQISQRNSIEKFVQSKEINRSDAALILANGEQINMSQNQSNVKYSADGTGVLVNDTSELKQTLEKDGFNEIIVPYGKRSNLILSDGTKVWINSGSHLVFSPVFKGKTREVFLEGEAYFEVAKDEKKPFYVRTDEFKVKVYGTKFDLQAYKNSSEYNTILIEGKVSLELNNGSILSKEHFLYPDQKATLSEDRDNFIIAEVANIENYTAWKEGYLIFKNEAFPSILNRVSHYYNININLDAEIKLKRLSGKLDLKDDPERVLDGLALISKCRYEKKLNKYDFYE